MTQKIELRMPYHTQHNNDADWNSGPWNECSYTCMAMGLAALGIKGTGDGQLEDQIERSYENLGLTRGSPYDMAYWINEVYADLGIHDELRMNGTWSQILTALSCGRPIILHTDLTASGHVIAVRGYDPDAYWGHGALICMDPWGEWFPTGYDTSASGDSVLYSQGLIARKCGPDSNYWIHELSRELR